MRKADFIIFIYFYNKYFIFHKDVNRDKESLEEKWGVAQGGLSQVGLIQIGLAQMGLAQGCLAQAALVQVGVA